MDEVGGSDYPVYGRVQEILIWEDEKLFVVAQLETLQKMAVISLLKKTLLLLKTQKCKHLMVHARGVCIKDKEAEIESTSKPLNLAYTRLDMILVIKETHIYEHQLLSNTFYQQDN